MNLPQTVDELIHWDFSTAKDKLGDIHIITGFEDTDCCFWCGDPLTGKQKRWCRGKGHWKLYYQHFEWAYARSWCFERYDYTCANCGYHEIIPDGDHPSWYTKGLEAHHIIPLEGMERAYSPYNVPWNLICLCHYCHQLIHAVMRDSRRSSVLDVFDLALARG